jgi:hypothetical protein
MTANSIARLKVTLDDVKPTVQRQVEMPLTIRLDRLHLVLQAAMGWTNSHLYEIRARDIGWGLPDPDFGNGPLDAKKARLIDVLEDAGVKTVKYLYDFGDGWEHTVKVERITDAVPGLIYPRLIDASGRCPPEDVGGSWGYAEFLDALADPAHANHAEMKDWIAETFDPKAVDVEALSNDVAALAKAWTRKPPTKRKLSS